MRRFRIGVLWLGLSLVCGMAFANISDSKAIEAVLGEAGPSYAERFAISQAIRNRGSLQGVYGHRKAKDAREWQEASRAWYGAELAPDVTKGAKYWLSDYDLKYCRASRIAFRLKMQETAYIGHSHFYKEIGK